MRTAPVRAFRWYGGRLPSMWRVKDSNLGSFRDGLTVRTTAVIVSRPAGTSTSCADGIGALVPRDVPDPQLLTEIERSCGVEGKGDPIPPLIGSRWHCGSVRETRSTRTSAADSDAARLKHASRRDGCAREA